MNIINSIRSSIRWKLLLIMLILILIPIVLGGWYQLKTQKESFSNSLESRIVLMKKGLATQGKILSVQLSSQVRNNIAAFNFSSISMILRRSVEENEDLSYAILMDTSRIAYVHTLKPSMEQEVLNGKEDLFASKQKSAIMHEYKINNEPYLEFIVPIRVSTEKWGVLRLGFSTRPLNNDIQTLANANKKVVEAIFQNTLLLSAIMLLLGGFLITWMSRRMTRSISILTDHTKALAKGDFSASEDSIVKSGDEIEALSNAFSDMAKNLMTAYETLEEKVALRTDELAEARDEALAATEAKGRFLASMSHEIRTPMNAILGLNHLALKTELNAKQRDYLNKVQISAKSLLGIINDILDFSKIEAGKLDIELIELNLDDVLTQLSDVSSELAERKGLELHFHKDPSIPSKLIGDPLRINQILLNLVSNAVKFTDFGEIVVRIEREPDSTLAENLLRLRFSVIDTGIGLTDKQISRLFQSFSQADSSTTRKYGGTGLGLAICKNLVELMNGKVWVESEQGAGSRFIFTVCFELPTGISQIKEQLLLPKKLQHRRVMIVDDNATSLEILEEYLASFGFETTCTQSGASALRLLEQESKKDVFYDLILMDYMMPEMDGIEATRLIKRSDKINKIPTIIMVTAHNRSDVIEAAEQVNMDGFLTKPVGQSILFNSIMKIFHGDEAYVPQSMETSDENNHVLENLKNLHVLLAEDNLINQQVAIEILEDVGIQVAVANNGQEAVDMAEKEIYDVILMDLQMPVMGGLEATKQIRLKNSSIPIIAMTAHAMKEEIDRCFEVGMNDHTSKPIDTKKLFAKLAKWGKEKQEMKSKQKKEAVVLTDAIIPEQLLGVDIPQALKILNGNKKLLHKLLIMFNKQFSDADIHIQDALQADDVELALGLLHSIKGTSGNIGLSKLYESSCVYEKHLLINTDDYDAKVIEKVHNDFSQNLRELLGSISSLNQ